MRTARSILLFLLGVLLIVDYATSAIGAKSELIAGLILVGTLPLDLIRRNGHRRDTSSDTSSDT